MSFSKIFNLKFTCLNIFKTNQLKTRQFSLSSKILFQNWKYTVTLGVIATSSYFLVNFCSPKNAFNNQKKINQIFNDTLIEINRNFKILAKETENSQVFCNFYYHGISM